MRVTEQAPSPHHSSREGRLPRLIVYHIADGSYEGTKSWFAQPGSQVSAHFIVARDGRVCQCVPLERMAWCNGTSAFPADARYCGHSTVPLVRELGGNANRYSVSIECEGYWKEHGGALTEQQLDALVRLTQHIREEVRERFGTEIPADRAHLVGHCEVTPRTRPHCPGENFPWEELLRRLAPPRMYGVVRQVIALSDRRRAEQYATALNAEMNNDSYYKVIEI